MPRKILQSKKNQISYLFLLTCHPIFIAIVSNFTIEDKEFQTSKKSLKEKNLTNEHAFTELTQPKIKKTIPTSTFKKKKGRKRAQTSLVTFELVYFA